MTVHLHQPLARIIGLGAVVFLWLGALTFLAQDGCFDHGGALANSGFACAQADGSVVSLVVFVRPELALLVGVALGIPALLLGRRFGQRMGGRK